MSSRQNTHRAAKTKADPAAVWIGKFNAVHRAACATGQQYVSETFKMGDTLIAAKADLKEKRQHGRFEKMVRELPIKERSAQYLMTISKDERLRKAHHGALLLPTSWRTLAEITRLTDKEFEAAVANGTIDPETRRRDIEEIINARSLQQVVAASSRARAKVKMSEADFEARARGRRPS